MFKLFSGGASAVTSWPLTSIVKALDAQYDSVDKLGEDGPLAVYGVADNGVNFVLALVQNAPGSGDVVELGFLARFIGFPVTAQVVENINRNLHISVATIEGSELFLMAGLQVAGPYDDTQFALVMESWRRDLALTIHSIMGDGASLADAFPAARMDAARQFAANVAPEAGAAGGVDMLKSFLGGKSGAHHETCEFCNGRGKRGLIARTCIDCDGVGFVASSRR